MAIAYPGRSPEAAKALPAAHARRVETANTEAVQTIFGAAQRIIAGNKQAAR